MLGWLPDSFVHCLRDFQEGREKGLSVLRANDSDGKAIVNTSLPCAAVCLTKSESTKQFIGGKIFERPVVLIQFILDFQNYSVTQDECKASDMDDMVFRAFRYIEQCVSDVNNPHFAGLRAAYDFNAVYGGWDTYTTHAFDKNVGMEVKVYSLTYVCNIFDRETNAQKSVELAEVDLKLYDVNLSTMAPAGEPSETDIIYPPKINEKPN